MTMQTAVQQAISDLVANPFGVRNEKTGAQFLVLDAERPVPPATMIAMANGAEAKTTLNLMGGCSQMSAADKEAMLEFFGTAMEHCFYGAFFSGATRDVKQASDEEPLLTDPMVTDVPTLVARLNPGCLALGSTPKVRNAMAQLRGRGLQISDYSYINWDYDLVVVVQKGVEESAEWDGDVPMRRRAIDMLRDQSRHKVGAAAWNGGGITGKEIVLTLKSGDPIILVEGSGRRTDELITAYRNGSWSEFSSDRKPEGVYIVSKSKPDDFRAALKDMGLTSAAPVASV